MACTRAAALSLAGSRTLVVAVEDNRCALDVSAASLGLDDDAGVVVVGSYMEALGLLAAHKAGVNPACLTAEVASIRDLGVGPAIEEPAAPAATTPAAEEPASPMISV